MACRSGGACLPSDEAIRGARGSVVGMLRTRALEGPVTTYAILFANAQQQSGEGRLSSRSHRTTTGEAEDRHSQGRKPADALHRGKKLGSTKRYTQAFVSGPLTALRYVLLIGSTSALCHCVL